MKIAFYTQEKLLLGGSLKEQISAENKRVAPQRPGCRQKQMGDVSAYRFANAAVVHSNGCLSILSQWQHMGTVVQQGQERW